MFSLFSELPPELRCIIRGYALTERQIHVLRRSSHNGIMSKHRYSRINLIMQACQEARNQGFKLKLPYLLIDSQTLLTNWMLAKDLTSGTYVRSYINNAEDIVWISNRKLFPRKLYCSRCDPLPHTWDKLYWGESLRMPNDCKWQSPPGLGTIAMN
ncbi:hypothetical protein BDZ45DRAFT_737127 [Acephala macrosclerotiorum]|nr:hypothetical protein BDZ45DRAFT_737127 [Acephala macrosclerotiorum]